MPMYFPDLESVKQVCEIMSKHKSDKKYTGIIPQTEGDLPEARIQLGRYFRTVWNDEIAALEVEKAVTRENYQKIMDESFIGRIHSQF